MNHLESVSAVKYTGSVQSKEKGLDLIQCLKLFPFFCFPECAINF